MYMMQWRLLRQNSWKLKRRFKKTFKFSNNNINKFILFLRKSVYCYEYMDDLILIINLTLRINIWKILENVANDFG